MIVPPRPPGCYTAHKVCECTQGACEGGGTDSRATLQLGPSFPSLFASLCVAPEAERPSRAGRQDSSRTQHARRRRRVHGARTVQSGPAPAPSWPSSELHRTARLGSFMNPVYDMYTLTEDLLVQHDATPPSTPPWRHHRHARRYDSLQGMKCIRFKQRSLFACCANFIILRKQTPGHRTLAPCSHTVTNRTRRDETANADPANA